MLGVGMRSPNYLVNGELGRFAIYIIIIMYIYHALINALSAHMIHINLNMIFYINAQIRCYRHWLKLTRMNEDRLPFKVHEMLCNLDETGKKKLDV